MKRLILFKGGVETLEFFTEQMAAVWEKMGCSVFWYNLMLQQASSSALVEFFKAHSSDEWYMFTFNFEGIAGEAGLYRDDGWNFWDWAGVKAVSYTHLNSDGTLTSPTGSNGTTNWGKNTTWTKVQ